MTATLKKSILIAVFVFLSMAAVAQTEHKVRRGETFESIAQSYGITVEELRDANPSKAKCYGGSTLTIPQRKLAANSMSNASGSNYAASGGEEASSDISSSSDTDPVPQPKKKKSFWKKVGVGALVVAGVAAGVALGVAEAKSGGSSASATMPDVSAAGTDYSSGGSSGSNRSSASHASDKCKYCHGTGKCTYYKRISKSYCNGTGRCQSCMGNGWLDRPESLCPNCYSNHNGKCKSCAGTGKCKYCGGSGKA